MISAWKRRLSSTTERRRAGKSTTSDQPVDSNNNTADDDMEEELAAIPTHFRCPISLDMMKDPVTLTTGITYDRECIDKWIEAGNNTCPLTNQQVVLTSNSSFFDHTPNHALRKMIQFWCVENRSSGIERIPTPRIPVTPHEVSNICSKITLATQRGDQKSCMELVRKIKTLGKESERNKRCIKENGTGRVLWASFQSFSSKTLVVSMEIKHTNIIVAELLLLLEEMLSILTWTIMFSSHSGSASASAPQDFQLFMPASSSSSRCNLVWFLKSSADLSARQNAVLVLKQLLSLNHINRHAIALADQIDEVIDALFWMIKEPISPTATKASLVAISHLISSSSPSSSSEKIATRFVELGLVSLILETLVDAKERGICEKALIVLDIICNYKPGLEKACKHALTTPVLVKKILRVSDLATELSVSVLWKLCCSNDKMKKNKEGDLLVVEAIQVGAFQKILVMLQVGCAEDTKHKVTGLLKLMNQFRHRVDCFDSSMPFNYIQRPF